MTFGDCIRIRVGFSHVDTLFGKVIEGPQNAHFIS